MRGLRRTISAFKTVANATQAAYGINALAAARVNLPRRRHVREYRALKCHNIGKCKGGLMLPKEQL